MHYFCTPAALSHSRDTPELQRSKHCHLSLVFPNSSSQRRVELLRQCGFESIRKKKLMHTTRQNDPEQARLTDAFLHQM